ncbi:MAG TPA: hypothetical protein VHY08_12205 [Bacillota bacterium]|nr:hypothetical protein [Bacillota bacterium]
MTKYLKPMSRLFQIILLFLLIMVTITSGGAYAADQETGATLKHVDTKVFNDYIATMIKAKEAEMKAAVTKEKDFTDFKLRDADFDILTGKILIKFTLYYKKKTDITGALRFEVRLSNDGTSSTDDTPKIGAYCLGIDGGLHSTKFFADLILALAKGAINKRLTGKQFWSDQQDHPQYMVFKNENLNSIVNQAFLDTSAGKEQFQKFSQPFLGGEAEVEFINLTCNTFDISVGQAEITSGLTAVVKLDFAGNYKFDNAGTMTAGFDFYINPQNQSWWVKLSKFKLHLNILTGNLNDLVQEIIDKELSSREILIPIDMPQSDQL